VSDDVPVLVPPAVPTNPPDREQFWREAIAAFTSSGQTVRAFCRDRGLHEKRFYTWRRNLGLSPAGRPVSSPSHAPVAFVPVRVVSDASVEVVLPGGVTVRLPLSADPSHAARLVAALRGGPC
jgi:transposase-like protein